MKKICIISNLHLCDNPRVWKEATSLAEVYQVYVLTTWSSTEKRQKDIAILARSKVEYLAGLNLIPEESSWFSRVWHKFKSRLALEAKLRMGLDNPLLLGYDPMPTVQAAIDLSADLYICHAELSLYIGKKLIERGKKVAYDFEDWYSRDYLVPSRPVRLLQELEHFALHQGVYCTCPSVAMAQAMSLSYAAPQNIEVIYNGFSVLENDQMVPTIESAEKTPSLVWFSQTIGPGRGLEPLIEALHFLPINIQLHLIGDCSKEYKQVLEGFFAGSHSHQLFFHAQVPHAQLLPTLNKFIIGLALEHNNPPSRDTTITNKILQYIQAGIKVLATPTQGQQEIAPFFPNGIALVNFNDPQHWAKTIDELIQKPALDSLEQLSIFHQYFSWEAQEQKLFKLVDDALAK